MLSGRVGKWILVVVLLLGAIYAAYPPVEVPVEKKVVTEKIAQTSEVAKEHNVEVGETYKKDTESEERGWLPLALSKQGSREKIEERVQDGTLVREKTTTKYVLGRIKLGLDIAGGTELTYKLNPKEGQKLGEKLDKTINILKQRIAPSNIKQYRIQPVGEERILIQVPRASLEEVEALKERLTTMGKLEFKLAVPRDSKKEEFQEMYKAAAQGEKVPGYTKLYREGDASNEFYLVKEGPAELTGQRLAQVYPRRDQYGQPIVGFELDSVGARKFAMVTENNRGRLLAIILDGVLKSAPVIRTRIEERGQIEGNFTWEEVQRMVTVLQSGSLPVDLELLQESTVGPELGQDSIQKGLWSIAVAGVLVLVFIGIYYMTCGLIADGALIMNIVLLVGVLGLLGAALTLPGVAGILLTVGMAVDANVLIFERIREEYSSGKGMRVSLRNGYDRAYSTIIDANVTTLLTAIILYLVGTGPVRGFAITLSAGIVFSMFTALFVTRLVLETLIAKEWLKEFKMFSIVGEPEIPFSSKRRVAYVVSAVVLVVGLGFFFGRGRALYDIDFTGGSLAYLSLPQNTEVDTVRDRVNEAGFDRAQVQEVEGAAGAEGIQKAAFAVRVKGAGVKRGQSEVKNKVGKALQDAGLKEDPEVEVSSDGRTLLLELDQAADETALREALAGSKEGAFRLDYATEVVPSANITASKYEIRFPDVPPLMSKRELWGKARAALAWAKVENESYSLQLGEVDGEGGSANLSVTLDKAVDPAIFMTEVDKRGFDALDVNGSQTATKTLQLTGPADGLKQFKKEMPRTVRLPRISKADGALVAELSSPINEQDLRNFFERQEIQKVVLVPTGAKSPVYTVQLSTEPVKARLQSAFADMGTGAEVGFEEIETAAAEPGRVRVKMALPEPMQFVEVLTALEQAQLGVAPEEIVVSEHQPKDSVESVILSLPDSKKEETQDLIASVFREPQVIQKIVSIGSVVAEEMKGRALLAVICASVIIVIYVTIRFHAIKFGIAAVIALIHDVTIAAGLVALADWTGVMGDIKINLAMLAAFLTILGYSLNDTIVVFDRIRENLYEMGRKTVDAEVIDTSINQTLSRTFLTSLTTLMVVLVLYLLGGPVLQGLAFTLIVGVLVGTYSSIFIASPILLDWEMVKNGARIFFKVLFFPVTAPFKVADALRGSSSS